MRADYASLLPNAPALQSLCAAPLLRPFDPAALAFVEAVSTALLASSAAARRHPELVALAYWMRRASITRLRQTVESANAGRILMPRGMVFHVAPSNVDSIFVYSWFMSLLAGNANVVRLSSRASAQTGVLTNILKNLLTQDEHAAIAQRTLLVQYQAKYEINALFSSLCQVRVVWGGDATVASLREVPLPPTATELAFADKQSLALIDAFAWLAADVAQKQAAAQHFFNDVYWFNQLACSSPHQVLWLGEKDTVDTARSDFWPHVETRIVDEGVRFESSAYMQKRLTIDTLAANTETDNTLRILQGRNNALTRLWQERPNESLNIRGGHGLLLESRLDDLDDLRPLLNRRIQTLSYFGINEPQWRAFFSADVEPVRGLDRVVPFGQALNFAPVWDGFDLYRSFTREIQLV